MIRLTRLNGSEMYLNADLIATVESHHDTVVTLIDGKHYVVAESATDVVDAVTAYRASVLAAADAVVSQSVERAQPVAAPVYLLHRDTAGGE